MEIISAALLSLLVVAIGVNSYATRKETQEKIAQEKIAVETIGGETVTAFVIGPKAGDGTMENPLRHRVTDDYPVLDYHQSDWSPPMTPVVVGSIVVTQATLDLILADANYFVMWDDPNPRPPNGPPDAAEFGLLRAYLARAGMSQKQIKAAIGERDGRTRREIAAALAEWLQWQS